MKRRPKQLAILPKLSDVFVGPKRGTNAKSPRPLVSRRPIHVCMRSRFAKGRRTFLGANKLRVDQLVRGLSKQFGVTLLKYVNVGNHIHLVVKLPGSTMTARRQYKTWIRLLTSRIAFEIGGAKKGQPLLDENGARAKFWDALPFSRVIYGRRGWSVMDRYVLKNELQAQGHSKEFATLLARELFESSRIWQWRGRAQQPPADTGQAPSRAWRLNALGCRSGIFLNITQLTSRPFPGTG